MSSAVPRWVEPQLATLVRAVPEGNDWLHEIKVDGYRMFGCVDARAVALTSRHAKDWSRPFAIVTEALRALRVRSALVDGEVAAFQPNGTSSFQSLRQGGGAAGAVLAFVLFDVLFLDGRDLRGAPLIDRKERLRDLVAASPLAAPTVRFSDYIAGRGGEVWTGVSRMSGVEGVVSKRATSQYVGGRSVAWQKTKCVQRRTFLVGGYEPDGRTGVRRLLVGTRVDDKLVYTGRVGTGISYRDGAAMRARFERQHARTSPFVGGPRGGAAWVTPEIGVEVEYLEITAGGSLRHAVFRGLVAG
jgi:bifunctional non-homologous end joining protein LigD